MNTNYYVYVYLDPRKPGEYVYNDYKFDFEPFYIGKGINNRMNVHLNKAIKMERGKHPFIDKIQKLFSLDLFPIILKVNENLNEDEAFNLELSLILNIGRLTEGPLTNLTDGGEGVRRSGWKHTEETKKKLSIIHTGMKHTKESLNKMSKSQKGKRTGSENIMYNTCLVFNKSTNETKRIKKEELQNYLDLEWVQGAKYNFSDETLKEISERMKKVNRSKENNPAFNTSWMYNPADNKRKRIKIDKIAEYLNTGWVIGQKPVESNFKVIYPEKETCFVFNDKLQKSKKIKRTELDEYLNNGWIKGRK